MAWTDVSARIRSILNDPEATRWKEEELERWYNTGVEQQNQLVFRMAKAAESGDQFRSYENDYLKHFIKTYAGTFTVGTQDYDLPSDFWRMAKVTVGTAPEYEADAVHFNEDWDIREIPHRGPTSTRPKYCLIPHYDAAGKWRIRFYVAPGVRTAPNATTAFKLYYYRRPIPVDQSASPPVDVDLDEPYHDGPIQYACYMANIKFRLNGSVHREEFQQHVVSILEGPSPEVPGMQGDKK